MIDVTEHIDDIKKELEEARRLKEELRRELEEARREKEARLSRAQQHFEEEAHPRSRARRVTPPGHRDRSDPSGMLT